MSLQRERDDEWRNDAMCLGQDPAKWFPPGSFSNNSHRQGRISEEQILADRRYAEQVCRGCPVKAPCLAFALQAKEKWGVYGGVSEYDRRQIRRASWKERKRARREGR